MSDLNEEARKLWGKKLKAQPDAALAAVPLSTVTRRFLIEVGLPRITTDSELVTLYPQARLTQIGSEQFIEIGDDYGTSLVLRPDEDAVWSVDKKQELPTRFVNSSVQALLIFLALHKKYSRQMDETATEEEFEAVADKLVEKYRDVDAKAMSDEENYWSVIVEQTRDGLI